MNQNLMIALHEIIALVDRSADVTLREKFGISFSWFRLLVVLSSIEPATQHRLAVCLGHSDAAISRLLAKMAAAELVEMTTDPAHKRKHVVALTAKGHSLAANGTRLLGGAFEAEMQRAGVDIEQYTAMTLAIVATLRKGT